ncbi:anthranilate phosphoribosyltransferase [Blastocladiella emersonii ATCC 22665]|nr:anthranilate phosphoribosyltransferase [Blastocladiella emersonii ATCC 22665]
MTMDQLLPAAAFAAPPPSKKPDAAAKAALKSRLKSLVLSPRTPPTDVAAILGAMLDGVASPAQIAAFLVAVRLHALDADPAVVAACATEMQRHATPVDLSLLPSDAVVVDIVGTGGDGHDTFNVSTTAALVAAATGCTVAKHGNRASSSACGSADVLEAAGCRIAALGPADVAPALQQLGFCFLFAQTFHPAMRHVAPTRRELGIPSIFNVLGPLSNPANPHRAVIGVYHRSVAPLVARTLALMGVRRALVVCGHEGLDEISPAGPTDVWVLGEDGSVTEMTIQPKDFGLPTYPLAAVRGGDKAYNAGILATLVQGELPRDHPIVAYVALNAAALIYLAGRAESFGEGVKLALDAVYQGRVKQVLDGFRTFTESRASSPQQS